MLNLIKRPILLLIFFCLFLLSQKCKLFCEGQDVFVSSEKRPFEESAENDRKDEEYTDNAITKNRGDVILEGERREVIDTDATFDIKRIDENNNNVGVCKKKEDEYRRNKNVVNYKNEYEYGWIGPVYALGDLHGDFENTVAILQSAGLIDDDLSWAGENALLVQVGDIWDKGPNPAEIHELFDKLEKEAEEKGGKIIRLMGNHEVMNLDGNYCCLHNNEKKGWSWKEERDRLFSPHGKYGKTILNMPFCVKINNVVFVHAGFSYEYAKRGIKRINTVDKAAVINYFEKKHLKKEQQKRHDRTGNYTNKYFKKNRYNKRKSSRRDNFIGKNKDLGVIYRHGILNNDDLAKGHYDEGSVDEILRLLEAKHIVVGHARTKWYIQSLYGGKVYNIDTGIAMHSRNAPSILKITEQGNKFEAITCKPAHGYVKAYE